MHGKDEGRDVSRSEGMTTTGVAVGSRNELAHWRSAHVGDNPLDSTQLGLGTEARMARQVHGREMGLLSA